MFKSLRSIFKLGMGSGMRLADENEAKSMSLCVCVATRVLKDIAVNKT